MTTGFTIWIIIISFLSLVIVFLIWTERGHLILPGTFQALKWLGLKKTLAIGWKGILYGRWTVPYIKANSFLLQKLSRWKPGVSFLNRIIAERYHGKVLTPEHAKAIITIEQDVPLQDLGDRIIPYSRARDIVLKSGDDLALFQCGCKASRKEPCKVMHEKPYMSCILIGKPLVNFLLPHNPATSRRITRDEALRLLEEFHDMGLVHNAWFKDAINDQMYVICNCCSCCCLGFESMRLGVRQLTSSGYIAFVDDNSCKGCESALDCCPFGAITMVHGKSHVDPDKCMGCGVCVSKCPNHVRTLKLSPAKGLPLDVTQLHEHGHAMQ